LKCSDFRGRRGVIPASLPAGPEKSRDTFRVFLPGIYADFGIAPRTDEMIVFQAYVSGGEHPRVGELLAHVEMGHAVGEKKGDGLPGKIFTEYIFHGASNQPFTLEIVAYGGQSPPAPILRQGFARKSL
jgi:hypothetical protein